MAEPEALLEVNSLRARYGEAEILAGVTLSVARDEVVAVIGRNGAGKTTTLKSVIGLVRPSGGRVVFDGSDVTMADPHVRARAGLGYVPEDRRVFAGLTVAENLEVGRRPARPDAPFWDEARLFELFPNLAERRRQLAGRLSGGEQQMLTVARTLIGNPRLVLLDEPSEGVAPVIVDQLARIIGRLKSDGLAVLLSEQNLRFAGAVSDRAIVLEKGTVRFEGTFADLRGSPELLSETLAV